MNDYTEDRKILNRLYSQIYDLDRLLEISTPSIERLRDRLYKQECSNLRDFDEKMRLIRALRADISLFKHLNNRVHSET